MSEITIDAGTAHIMGDVCAEIAKAAGVNPLYGGLVASGISLAVRLSDAGYAVPSMAELQRKQEEIAALPELAES